MTVLKNSVHVSAGPQQVWSVLARLDALHEYDPGISKSEICSSSTEGPGSERRCEIASGGWFRERVTTWMPYRELEFTLCDCSLPVRALRHHYTVVSEQGGTRVEQMQEYELKYGVLGTLLDSVLIKRQWDSGIKAFFAGLKRHIETTQR